MKDPIDPVLTTNTALIGHVKVWNAAGIKRQSKIMYFHIYKVGNMQVPAKHRSI